MTIADEIRAELTAAIVTNEDGLTEDVSWTTGAATPVTYGPFKAKVDRPGVERRGGGSSGERNVDAIADSIEVQLLIDETGLNGVPAAALLAYRSDKGATMTIDSTVYAVEDLGRNNGFTQIVHLRRRHTARRQRDDLYD